jgi:IS5 family transposase
LSQAAQLVHADLVHPKTKRLGRKGLPADQVLRAMLIKQLNGFSYEELAFIWLIRTATGGSAGLASETRRPRSRRCRRTSSASELRPGKPSTECWSATPSITRSRAATRSERTARRVESNIHHPNDSSLLWDCTRVLTRLISEAQERGFRSFKAYVTASVLTCNLLVVARHLLDT